MSVAFQRDELAIRFMDECERREGATAHDLADVAFAFFVEGATLVARQLKGEIPNSRAWEGAAICSIECAETYLDAKREAKVRQERKQGEPT